MNISVLQVLSWLVKKGEETLKKHSELTTSLQGIKKQEQDFEKFYFASMVSIPSIYQPKEVFNKKMIFF